MFEDPSYEEDMGSQGRWISIVPVCGHVPLIRLKPCPSNLDSHMAVLHSKETTITKHVLCDMLQEGH